MDESEVANNKYQSYFADIFRFICVHFLNHQNEMVENFSLPFTIFWLCECEAKTIIICKKQMYARIDLVTIAI